MDINKYILKKLKGLSRIFIIYIGRFSAFNQIRLKILRDVSFIRRDSVIQRIIKFNPHMNVNKASDKIWIFILYEADKTFRWLETANKKGKYELIYIPRSIFNPIWNYTLRSYKNAQNLGESALDKYFRPEYKAEREQFKQYCKNVFQILIDEFPVDVFLFPKLNDDWITDLIPAALETSVPVVVNDREAASTKKRMEVYPPILKKCIDFKVDALCVSNPTHREFFIKGGYDPDGIELIGKLNSDYWQRKDYWRKTKEIHPDLDSNKIKLFYFSFGEMTYLNFFYRGETRSWNNLIQDYHDVLVRILQKYGDKLQLVYKTGGKPQRDYFSGYDDFINEIKMCPPNSFLPLNVKYIKAYDDTSPGRK